MNRDKVIKWLECRKEHICRVCPYYCENDGGPCLMYADTIALLKEPETVKCGVFYREDDKDEWYTYPNHCVSCGHTWMGSTNYCPNCGLKLKEVDILEGKDESGRCD